MVNQYFIGTSGWNYPHWKGIFYPTVLPKKNWFDFYSNHFNTVEINYTFYKWPLEKTLKNWYKSSPSKFKFVLKAPRTITHTKKLKEVKNYVKSFYKLSKNLHEKLLGILFQLPPSYDKTEKNLNKLKIFLETLDLNINNIIEFRHKSWWTKETYNLLKEYNVVFCIVSGMDMPKDFVVTSDIVYVRFHGGHYDSKYSEEDIKNYFKKIKKLEVKLVFCYFNNDLNGYAIDNAKMLISEVENA